MNLNNKDKQIGRRLGIWIWFLSILFIPQITLFAQGPDTLWTKTYGGTYDDQGHSVKQTNDGGYIIAGMTFRPGSEYDVYLIKTDASGNTQWQKIYGGTGRDNGWSVQQTIDGGYIIAGTTWSFGGGNGYSDVYLIKTDALGDTLWTKTYGGIYGDHGYSVQQTNDGGYIITGWTATCYPYYSYLIKTDASGDTLWTKAYVGGGGYSVQQTTDGGYIIGGASLHDDVYLIKTDASGDTSWTKTCGGTGYDQGYSVVQTTDRGYIITGWTESFGAGNYDVYLIRLGTETGIEEKSSSQLSTLNSQLHLKASPNPFSKTTVIELNPRLSGSPTPQLKIYDLSGRLIRTFPSFRLAPRSSVVWDGKDGQGKEVKNGVYFARLEYNGCVAIRQMILFEVKK